MGFSIETVSLLQDDYAAPAQELDVTDDELLGYDDAGLPT